MKREILHGSGGLKGIGRCSREAFHAEPESDACDVAGADGSQLDSGRVARLEGHHMPRLSPFVLMLVRCCFAGQVSVSPFRSLLSRFHQR